MQHQEIRVKERSTLGHKIERRIIEKRSVLGRSASRKNGGFRAVRGVENKPVDGPVFDALGD